MHFENFPCILKTYPKPLVRFAHYKLIHKGMTHLPGLSPRKKSRFCKPGIVSGKYSKHPAFTVGNLHRTWFVDISRIYFAIRGPIKAEAGNTLAQVQLDFVTQSKVMNAFIIYDSFSLASKANTLLHRASANAGDSPDWNVTPWRTQMLRVQPYSEIAHRDAADAHLIVFAWLNNRPFHQWIKEWLEQWILGRKVEEAAIAILGESEDICQSSAALELKHFAEARGVSLIVGQMEMTGTATSNPGQAHADSIQFSGDGSDSRTLGA
jgi:hypothetical protein